jgi:hypothetical protein
MKRLIGALGTALSLAVAGVAQAGEAKIEDTGPIASGGDMVLIGLPIVAFGLTWLLDSHTDKADKPAAPSSFTGTVGGVDFVHMTGSPRHDLGLALLRTELVTFGLKGMVTEERPNGEPHSFPSAHTSTTFAAAEFVRKEYGWGWGTPAYLAASFAGYSRVEANEHWWQDVAAGAAIGILSNHDFGEMHGWRIQPGLLGFRKPQADNDGVAPGLHFEKPFGH